MISIPETNVKNIFTDHSYIIQIDMPIKHVKYVRNVMSVTDYICSLLVFVDWRSL